MPIDIPLVGAHLSGYVSRRGPVTCSKIITDVSALSGDGLALVRALYSSWQDQRVCIKIEAMHCDICHVTSESIYLQKKQALNWKIKGRMGLPQGLEG